MKRIATVDEIFDAIQRIKANAPAFRSNIFPIKEQLRDGVDRGEWARTSRDGAAFFLRRDRDIWHLYFSAASTTALQVALQSLAELTTLPLVLDLVGQESSVQDLAAVFQSAGFRSYARLLRLVRMPPPAPAGPTLKARHILLAAESDSVSIHDLMMRSFDRYAEQIPDEREIAAAAKNQQVLMISDGVKPAAILYFESRGLTSAVRYWLVDVSYRGTGYGSALMRHYLAIQDSAKRFILWVRAENADAIRKYGHYGYAPDGLSDLILANALAWEMARCATSE